MPTYVLAVEVKPNLLEDDSVENVAYILNEAINASDDPVVSMFFSVRPLSEILAC